MLWQHLVDAITRKFNNSRISSKLMTKLQHENELMFHIWAEREITQFVSLWLAECYKKREIKSLEKATKFRVSGNKKFQEKNYGSCIELYTKSAIYAPADSEDLAVSIANRSASFFYLNRYSDCVQDIELAIKLKYPEKLRYKLYLRASQCYLKLGKIKLARDTALQVREILNRRDDISNEKRESVEKQINELLSTIMENDLEDVTNITESRLKATVAFGENPNFRNASAAIDKKYTSYKGRHIIANRDIKQGQTLFVEKPFTFILSDYDKSHNVCENCCQSYGDNPIPCTTCFNTLFCNIKCCNAGWSSYHRWECSGNQMGLWKHVGISYLALRLLLTCATTTETVMFNEVQQLVTHFDDTSPEDLFLYGMVSMMITLYLAKYTDFFEVNNIKECLSLKFSDNTFNFDCNFVTKSDEQLYVSSLLLRHLLQLICNGNAITKLVTTISEKDKVYIEQQQRIASAIYLSASMMNHSCDPNIIASYVDQHIIIKAIKDIAAGEEVFNCYGPHFRRMAKEERQEILKTQYFFTCKCEACTLSEFQNFMERFTAMKCPECSGALRVLHNYSSYCLDCGATPTIIYHFEAKRAQSAHDAAQVYLDLGREEEALVKLKECLSIRREVLYKYHEDTMMTLDSIGRVYGLMGRWLESISYIEHSITGVEERFGSSSIEVANELNKLTDICIRYLQEEPHTTTKWYKNILKKTRRYLSRAEEILHFNYGPWNDIYDDITTKKKILYSILKDFNI